MSKRNLIWDEHIQISLVKLYYTNVIDIFLNIANMMRICPNLRNAVETFRDFANITIICLKLANLK